MEDANNCFISINTNISFGTNILLNITLTVSGYPTAVTETGQRPTATDESSHHPMANDETGHHPTAVDETVHNPWTWVVSIRPVCKQYFFNKKYMLSI